MNKTKKLLIFYFIHETLLSVPLLILAMFALCLYMIIIVKKVSSMASSNPIFGNWIDPKANDNIFESNPVQIEIIEMI